ncbi:hypothetical protein LR48_Vigan05g139500 [Vigna angularis]|uniref:Uncharacterized protein n=1 Tax=Phaseolus angularis TaxID=3914 RepID=A0A0L9ULK8_PHAAN|nr:hypothetical protein LR48_Vigan05g139500 [Vigna angularis]
MVSLGRIYKCGKRRNGFCTCGSEVLVAKSVREVKLRASGVARRPRCCKFVEMDSRFTKEVFKRRSFLGNHESSKAPRPLSSSDYT